MQGRNRLGGFLCGEMRAIALMLRTASSGRSEFFEQACN
jgi:hypothetical protein